jgi:hypothetical protein
VGALELRVVSYFDKQPKPLSATMDYCVASLPVLATCLCVRASKTQLLATFKAAEILLNARN